MARNSPLGRNIADWSSGGLVPVGCRWTAAAARSPVLKDGIESAPCGLRRRSVWRRCAGCDGRHVALCRGDPCAAHSRLDAAAGRSPVTQARTVPERCDEYRSTPPGRRQTRWRRCRGTRHARRRGPNRDPQAPALPAPHRSRPTPPPPKSRPSCGRVLPRPDAVPARARGTLATATAITGPPHRPRPRRSIARPTRRSIEPRRHRQSPASAYRRPSPPSRRPAPRARRGSPSAAPEAAGYQHEASAMGEDPRPTMSMPVPRTAAGRSAT